MNDIKIVNKSIELADSFRDALDSVSREKMWLAFTEAPPYEHTRKFVEGLIRDNDIQVYAVMGDTVVGWCDITRRKRDTYSHTGSLGMGIIKPHRGRGLGEKMLVECIRQAKSNGLEKVCLDVYSHNTAGIKLYEKLGFQYEGKRIKEAKIDGKFLDVVLMGLQLR